jgi:hypothetical protein
MKTSQRKKRELTTDLQDSNEDKKRLEPDEATLDLPDVKDIPGQEHVRPLVGGQLADTTISSADEEGGGLLDTDEESIMNKEIDVTRGERELLQRSSESMSTQDDDQLNKAHLDTTDDDGTLLNERVDNSGADLDVPGAEEDDSNEMLGEEDEENNPYSLPDQEDKE